MGISSAIYLILKGRFSLIMIVQLMTSGLENFTLLAIPFFIVAGQIMNSAGITQKIFDFANSLVGHVKGGLGHVNVLASMIFAGMSGSAVADTAGLGMVELKAMFDEGYDKSFSVGITGASSTIGPIIPPSITLILFGAMTGTSTGRLFLGGVIPGVIMGILLMITVYFVAKRDNYPVKSRSSIKEIKRTFYKAFPALLMPVIVIGGIITGVTTVTEAGAISVVYALFLGIVINKEIGIKELIHTLEKAIMATVPIMFILATARLFAWCIIMEKIPKFFTDFLINSVGDRTLILLLINVGLLIAGCFMSVTAVLITTTPILVEVALALKLDLVHVGVVVVLNLMIGLLTPPVGWSLYILSDIAKMSFGDVVKATIPFLIPLIVALLIITFNPILVIFLPNMIFGR